MGYPWAVLSHWQPFSIDALGLVTLLGSEQVDTYVGRLVTSRWLEYMPLLGAFVIASDRFREKTNAITLYNFSCGIMSTDLSPWFTRWMSVQDFETTRSIVYWEFVKKPREWFLYKAVSAAISFCLIGFLVVMTGLTEDWYGFANTLVMAVSVLVRAYVIQANRTAIDVACESAITHDQQKNASTETKAETGVGHTDSTSSSNAKTLLIMPDSKAVTMFIPKQFIIPVFTRKPEPANSVMYRICGWLGWAAFAVHIVTIGMAKLSTQLYTVILLIFPTILRAAFAVHIVTIGMAKLSTQLYTVILLIFPTILTCYGVGCDDCRLYRNRQNSAYEDEKSPYVCWIGSHLKATIFQWPVDAEFYETESAPEKPSRILRYTAIDTDGKAPKRSTRRQDLYAWLHLSQQEQESLEKWDLVPHARGLNTKWSDDWSRKKALIDSDLIDIEAVKDEAMAVAEKKLVNKVSDVESQRSKGPSVASS